MDFMAQRMGELSFQSDNERNLSESQIIEDFGKNSSDPKNFDGGPSVCNYAEMKQPEADDRFSEDDGCWMGSMTVPRKIGSAIDDEGYSDYEYQTVNSSINSSNSPWEVSGEDEGEFYIVEDGHNLLIAQNHMEEDDGSYDVIIEDVVSDEGEIISRKITTMTEEQADNKENDVMYSFNGIGY